MHSISHYRECGIPVFSLEHHVHSTIPGRINRKIYHSILREGIAKQSWVVRANLEDLAVEFDLTEDYVHSCLISIKNRGAILPIGHPSSSTLFLIPVLKDFVTSPKGLVDEIEAAGRAMPGRPKVGACDHNR